MEKTMECKETSVEGLVVQNRKTIKECLEISNFITALLADDNCLKETDIQATCLLSDLALQNQDLTTLLNMLLKIKSQLAGGVD